MYCYCKNTSSPVMLETYNGDTTRPPDVEQFSSPICRNGTCDLANLYVRYSIRMASFLNLKSIDYIMVNYEIFYLIVLSYLLSRSRLGEHRSYTLKNIIAFRISKYALLPYVY